MPTLRFGIALLALVTSTVSCSVLIDTKKEQCSVDADCANLGESSAAFAGSVCKESVCVKPEELGLLKQIAALPEAWAYAIEALPSVVAPKAPILRIRRS